MNIEFCDRILVQLESHMADNPAGIGLAISAILGKRARLERKLGVSRRSEFSSKLLEAIRTLIEERSEWVGTPTSLYSILSKRAYKMPGIQNLSRELEAIKNDLKSHGIDLAFSRKASSRLIHLSESSASESVTQ